MTSVLHVPESQYDSRMWWCTVECAEPERHIRFHAGYLTNLSILTNTEHSNSLWISGTILATVVR